MDRQKFKNLNDSERIKWVFEKYDEGLSTADLVKIYGIPKNTIGDTMRRNGYVGNRAKKIYESSFDKEEVYNQESIDDSLFSKNDDREELLLQMIKWYQEEKKNIERKEKVFEWVEDKIEKEKMDKITPTIDRNKLIGNLTIEPMTVYENILQEFNDFCEEQELSKQDIISMCLVEYMEKYK